MKATLFVGVALAALLGASLPAPAPAATPPSIFDTLAVSKDHSILSVAITEAKEVATLKTQEPVTLFAPTDAAFKKLDDATIKRIASDKEMVRKLVRAHIFDGAGAAKDLNAFDGKELRTRHGSALKVERLGDEVRVGGVKLAPVDIRCSNGTIHVIDTVLPLPKE